MASHRTQQNINNIKFANVLQPTAGELDYVPRKDRKTSSLDTKELDEPRSRSQKTEKRATSTAKTKSRKLSKKRKTKDKIINGRLHQDDNDDVGRSRSFKRSNSKSLKRSRHYNSKSPNQNQPVGKAVPDPYSRSRSNHSLNRGATPRMPKQDWKPSMNNSFSMSATTKDNLRNHTSQISFMS